MIEINELNFSYSGRGRQLYQSLSLNIAENGVYGLLGLNGEGKTTLLSLMCGLLRPKTGSVKLDGKEAFQGGVELLRNIFFVPDDGYMPYSTAAQAASFMRDFYPTFNGEFFADCLTAFAVPQENKLNAMSLGQRKKVLVSLALAAQTKYLLMDEPTNGLDIPSKTIFRQLVAKYVNEDSLVLISTHQVHDVENLLDHILILHHGVMQCEATIGELTDKYAFSIEQTNAQSADVLYSEPMPMGNAVMRRRTADMPETDINLELFFNAVVNGKLN